MNLDSERIRIWHLVAAVAVAMLMILLVGTVLGAVEWPILRFIHGRANQLLDLAVLAGNLITAIVVIGILRRASKTNFARAGRLLTDAALVAMVFAVQLVLAFVGSQVKFFFLVPFADLTQFDLSPVAKAALVGVVLPGIALLILLAVVRRRNAA